MKNFAASLLLCSLITLEEFETMAVHVDSGVRFIEDADDWDQSLYRRQAPQSLATVSAREDEKKEAKEGKEGKEGEAKEGEEEEIDPEW